MSYYTESMFVANCNEMCEQYEVRAYRETLEDCDPENVSGDDLRVLAERIGTALNDRSELIATLQNISANAGALNYEEIREIANACLTDHGRSATPIVSYLV